MSQAIQTPLNCIGEIQRWEDGEHIWHGKRHGETDKSIKEEGAKRAFSDYIIFSFFFCSSKTG